MYLQDLPVETVVRILSFLEWQDLLSVSQLNHFFRIVYQTVSELRYSVALQVSGMVDNDPSVDFRQKMNEVERKERAWRMMDLSNKVTVKVPHKTSHIYDLSGGVYLLGDCKASVVSRDTHSLRFFDLNTCSSGPRIRSEPWPEMSVGTSIVDIGFGLREFDLVAIIGIKRGQSDEPGEIILSLRELSTGGPHPLARIPDIVVDRVEDNTPGKLSIMLEIVGPSLLLLLTWHRPLRRPRAVDQDGMFLFNWWEGTKVMVETSPGNMWDGFVFLSPEIVLLPCRERGLEIIRLPDVTKGFSSKGFERILRLALPTCQPLVNVGAIQSRSEPNPFGAPHLSDVKGKTEFLERMHAKKRSPVAPDPMKSVVLLQMYYREFNTEPHDFLVGQWGVLRHNVSLIMHREYLLQLVASKMQSPPSPSSPSSSSASSLSSGGSGLTGVDITEGTGTEKESDVPVVPWVEWGSHARWMADDTHVSNWITTTAGQRYVGTDEEGHIVVRDFNPITVRRAQAAAASGTHGTESESGDDEDILMDDIGEGEMWEEDGSRSRVDYPMMFIPTEAASYSEVESEEGREGEAPPDVEESDEELLEQTLSVDENASEASRRTTGDSISQYANVQGTFSGPSTSTSTSTPVTSPSQRPASPTRRESTSSRGPEQRQENGIVVAEDATWKSVRVIEGYNEIERLELQQLFSEECKRPLPCVEYVSRRRYEHHGLLMDEERIIGLRHDERTGAIAEFDVFTL